MTPRRDAARLRYINRYDTSTTNVNFKMLLVDQIAECSDRTDSVGPEVFVRWKLIQFGV